MKPISAWFFPCSNSAGLVGGSHRQFITWMTGGCEPENDFPTIACCSSLLQSVFVQSKISIFHQHNSNNFLIHSTLLWWLGADGAVWSDMISWWVVMFCKKRIWFGLVSHCSAASTNIPPAPSTTARRRTNCTQTAIKPLSNCTLTDFQLHISRSSTALPPLA